MSPRNKIYWLKIRPKLRMIRFSMFQLRKAWRERKVKMKRKRKRQMKTCRNLRYRMCRQRRKKGKKKKRNKIGKNMMVSVTT